MRFEQGVNREGCMFCAFSYESGGGTWRCRRFPPVLYEPPVIPPRDMIANPEKAGPGIPLAAQKVKEANP